MKQSFLTLLSFVVFLFGCNQNNKPTDSNNIADQIYYGGDIITMEGEQPNYVEAVAIKNGKIVFTGSKSEAEKLKTDSTKMLNLEGKTLVPGFIDGHAHFFAFGAQAISANLLAAPDGNCNNIDELVNELKSWHQKNGTDKTNGWIIGIGFDDAALKEKRFPTKDDLDKVSKDIPVMAMHISAHFCSVNSKGLEVLGITAASKNPEGGIIRRVNGGKEPNGVLEELAAMPSMIKLITPTNRELGDVYMDAGQKMAASFGYTTANEGRAMGNHESMADFASRGKFIIDVNS